MALANYTDLQAEIADHLHRSDLTTPIPDLISLGESRLNKEVRCPSMEEIEVYSSSSRTLTIPPRFLQAKALYRLDSGYPAKLVQMDSDRFDLIAQDEATGTPEYYYISSSIYLNCASSGTTSYRLRYYKKLSLAADATNWLMTKYPDAYVYASLFAAAPYIKDDARVQLWGQLLSAAVDEINSTEKKINSPLMCESAITSIGAFNIQE